MWVTFFNKNGRSLYSFHLCHILPGFVTIVILGRIIDEKKTLLARTNDQAGYSLSDCADFERKSRASKRKRHVPDKISCRLSGDDLTIVKMLDLFDLAYLNDDICMSDYFVPSRPSSAQPSTSTLIHFAFFQKHLSG
jgi:hypothetical protein